MRTSLSVHDLSFTWPDGSTVVTGLDLAIGPGRHGLIGLNGSGKSTLLKLIADELAPTSGTITISGTLAYLPQDPESDRSRTVAQLLGIAETLEALDRMHAGDVRTVDFDLIGDDWDIAERSAAELGSLGLGHLDLTRTVATLSGGELVLLSLVALLLKRPTVLLLDEPTNNLDREARRRLVDVIASWKGTLLVVSHDRELLNTMDDIAELRRGEIAWYGGGYDDYERTVAAEQAAAERIVRSAESAVRAQRRDLIESHSKLASHARQGRAQAAKGGIPRIVVGARKRAAQQTAGRVTNVHQGRLADATSRLGDAESIVREDREIQIDLPATAVPARREVLLLDRVRTPYGDLELDLDVRGPERIGLSGHNGTGKTSLLRTITGELAPAGGTVDLKVPLRYLPQAMNVLRPELTVAENIALIAPEASETDRRSRLARFLFRGRDADQLASTLSGGERLRATLAALLLAEPAPQLLLLDEPTNNLDLASVKHLVDALRSYAGAFIVVSHDERFLDDLELTRLIEV